MGKEHPGLDRVPSSHSPHLQCLNSGLAPLMAQKQEGATRVQDGISAPRPQMDGSRSGTHTLMTKRAFLQGVMSLLENLLQKKWKKFSSPSLEGKHLKKGRRKSQAWGGAARWSPIVLQVDSRQHPLICDELPHHKWELPTPRGCSRTIQNRRLGHAAHSKLKVLCQNPTRTHRATATQRHCLPVTSLLKGKHSEGEKRSD